MLTSLAAMIFGWAAGFIYFLVYATCCTPGHRPTDQEAMLFWSAIFVFVSWMVVALPFAMVVAPTSRVLSLPIAPVVGAVVGLAAFALLLSWSGLWREPLFLAYAAVVGGAAALAYAIAVRLFNKPADEHSRSRFDG